MFEYWTTLVSEEKKVSFSIQCSPDDLPHYIYELLTSFGMTINHETGEILIPSLLTNTLELRTKIYAYVDKYKDKSPRINKLRTFIQDLKDNTYFYMLPNKSELSQKDHFMVLGELTSHIKGIENQDAFEKIMKDTFSTLFDKYTIEGASSERKVKVGEGLKSNRVCRFCDNTRAEKTTFKQEAHAISESLGNKTVILNEECDACNKYFSETIERDIDTYLKVFTTFFKVKNKENKVSTIKGKNFEFKPAYEGSEVDFVIVRYPDDEDGPSTGILDSIPLKFNEKVCYQNIYKALVKYALSVIDRKHISKFKNTIDWISDNNFKEKLPKVALLETYQTFTRQPQLSVYIRHDDDNSLPMAIGEFKFTYMTYVFIIPTFSSDEPDFSDSKNYERFWAFFKHYHSRNDWKYSDFSNPISDHFVLNMNFSQRGNN
ncbi:HNH endonuclease [Aeromonas hydrophila]|uniref:HNH endonuclease n=1 Tax=Aeromonas hydrophila TaxID=644 RepID=UPI00193251BE|nr:HNH endonuclease [Aeromonas hydrophila]MBM0511436.1 hypothetical protein [Aeromonas hydrophila]MBW3771022.1 HNH endonuclease [Aeromonas hydrophila]